MRDELLHACRDLGVSVGKHVKISAFEYQAPTLLGRDDINRGHCRSEESAFTEAFTGPELRQRSAVGAHREFAIVNKVKPVRVAASPQRPFSRGVVDLQPASGESRQRIRGAI